MIRTMVLGVVAIILVYGTYLAYPLIMGPKLTLVSPTEFSTLDSGPVFISGTAKRASELFLNGAPLLMDTEGNFATSFVLPEGGAILTLTAHDRMGRTVTLTRTVFIPHATTSPLIENHGEEENETSTTTEIIE